MSISIVPYKTEYQPYFDQYNREWITKFFWMEPLDEQVLTRPDEYIIAKGGEVWFAKMGDAIVGTYALLARPDGTFEFSKLGVAAKARGQKIGQKLLRHSYERAKARGSDKVIIFTSSSLKTANQLYRDEGFVDLALSDEEKLRYKRADVFLERPLEDIAA